MTPQPPSLREIELRVATATDAGRLLDLTVQLHDNADENADDQFRYLYRTVFSQGVTADVCRVYVAHPTNDPDRLVACGMAWVLQIMPAQWIPNGKMGYLQGFYTEPAWRGRGAAGSIARSLIAWLELTGCSWAQLHSLPEVAPIYRKLGFGPGRYDNFWLRLPVADVAS